MLYFLSDSRRGYCMHYASAATLMLRALGVPARYVQGYTVQTELGGGWLDVAPSPPPLKCMEGNSRGEGASPSPVSPRESRYSW